MDYYYYKIREDLKYEKYRETLQERKRTFVCSGLEFLSLVYKGTIKSGRSICAKLDVSLWDITVWRVSLLAEAL